jgi:acyl-CoA dehydrogenase
MSAEVQIIHEFGYTSPAYRSVFGTNVGIGSQAIVIDGTAEQKARYLPRLATGELIASFALTEPDAGSDAASITTTATRDGDHFVISGTKRYITNAPHAGLFTLLTRTAGGRADGITAFLVEAGTRGLTLGARDCKMGQRGAHTCDVILDDVRVPASAVIGGPKKIGHGFRTAMKVLDRGRLHISALAVGAARRLIDESLGYAMSRVQFGKPIADFQLIQAMLADSQTEYYAASCMVNDAARRFDAGGNVTIETSACKLFASEMCGRVADRAVQIFGGAGYMAAYPVERFYRDVRLFRLYEGTSQIQQLIIAKNMIAAAR